MSPIEILCVSIGPPSRLRRVAGAGLSASANIEHAQLEAFLTSTLELNVSGHRQVAAFAAGKPFAPKGFHYPKLVAENAVRALKHGHGRVRLALKSCKRNSTLRRLQEMKFARARFARI
jgi:hypothetical protein